MPTRSASWAASTRRPLSWRSASSRSSMRLKVPRTLPISSSRPTCRRCPGRRRSTVSIRCARRASGANAWRRSSALIAIVTTSPTTTPIASKTAIGKLIVTGVTISTIAIAVSRPALTAKTRQ